MNFVKLTDIVYRNQTTKSNCSYKVRLLKVPNLYFSTRTQSMTLWKA